MVKKKSPGKKVSKLSFQNDFYSDLNFSAMEYALIIRSPTDKGIITSISHDDLPDGYYIFTARDVPGKNIIDTPLGKVPIFSEGNISYLGEPLGILVGPDQKVLEKLLNEIEIVFDATPIESYLQNIHVETPAASKKSRKSAEKKESTVNHIEEFFSDILGSRTIKSGPCFIPDKKGKEKGIDSVFKTCDKVLESTWTYGMNLPDYREPNGAVCSWNGENLTVYTPTQWLSNLRFTLTESLNLPSDNILVKKTKSFSSSTNSIWYNSIIASQVAVAAMRTGKTVKLVYSRFEQTSFMETLNPISITHKTGINADGRILAMQVDIKVDAGAYNPFSQETVDRLAIASCGCYTSENLLVNAVARRSSTPPSSIDLEIIDTAAFFAIENQMNELSRLTSLSPVELRTLNTQEKLIPEQFPFSLKNKKFNEAMTALAKVSDFNRKYSSYNMDSKLRKQNFETTEAKDFYVTPLRGIGFACAFEGNGYYGSEIYDVDQYIETTLNQDGSFIIHTSPVSTSIQEIWLKTASSILQIPQSAIKFNSEFGAAKEPPLPESVFSNIGVMTELLTKCCETTKKQIAEGKYPINVKKKLPEKGKKLWNKEEFKGMPFHTNSFGAVTLELELNPFTYREHIRGINIVINCGKLLNVNAAESSIKIAVQKSLSNLVLKEPIESDKIHIAFIKSNDNPSHLGELVYNTLPAAYTQALTQALNCTIDSIPLETNTIFDRLRQQKEIEDALRKQKEEERIREEQEKKIQAEAKSQEEKKNKGAEDNEDSSNPK